jgi:hypothetical protein
MTPRRSPWFNARRDPPVNGGDDAVYEWRRKTMRRSNIKHRYKINLLSMRQCHHCQWRGLLRDPEHG